MNQVLSFPSIPAKRYFTIGEVSELCRVKPHVLRYWEKEFTQLRPSKRGGNRRYYQHHEVLMVRQICHLLYEQGYTIHGARDQLKGVTASKAQQKNGPRQSLDSSWLNPSENGLEANLGGLNTVLGDIANPEQTGADAAPPFSAQQVRWLQTQLLQLRATLSPRT